MDPIWLDYIFQNRWQNTTSYFIVSLNFPIFHLSIFRPSFQSANQATHMMWFPKDWCELLSWAGDPQMVFPWNLVNAPLIIPNLWSGILLVVNTSHLLAVIGIFYIIYFTGYDTDSLGYGVCVCVFVWDYIFSKYRNQIEHLINNCDRRMEASHFTTVKIFCCPEKKRQQQQHPFDTVSMWASFARFFWRQIPAKRTFVVFFPMKVIQNQANKNDTTSSNYSSPHEILEVLGP